MNTNWNQAAQKYWTADAARQQQKQEQDTKALRSHILRDEMRCQQVTDIENAVVELEEFMRADGQAAMELLRASRRHLNFGEEKNDGGGYGTVYFIDGSGLQKSVEAMGMWAAFSKNVKGPEITPITARQAIEAAVHYGDKMAKEVVSWLRSELDRIASSAPTSE